MTKRVLTVLKPANTDEIPFHEFSPNPSLQYPGATMQRTHGQSAITSSPFEDYIKVGVVDEHDDGG